MTATPSTPPQTGPATLRDVVLDRVGDGAFRVTNARGGTLDIGVDDADFSPVELLLAALAGCAAVNIEEITSRRAEPTTFAIASQGHKVRDDTGGRLVDLQLLIDVVFPDDEAGDAARAILPRVVRQTHERICTVSRTVSLGTPVEYVLPPADRAEQA